METTKTTIDFSSIDIDSIVSACRYNCADFSKLVFLITEETGLDYKKVENQCHQKFADENGSTEKWYKN